MTTPFPNDPYLSGYWEPFGAEIDAPDLVVEGELPAGLHGSFYRNGPDPMYPPAAEDKYHVFDGDGMIYAFHFEDGKVSMRNRWVRTEKFEMEEQAGKRLFGVFNNPRFSEPGVDPSKYNTGNTHIWPHGDKIYALMEGCPPIEMDPDTLETHGSQTYGGQITGPFTAHPKTDAHTGELFGFGWGAKGPGSTALRYNIIDKDNNLTKTEWLEQPYCSMMHDFFVTENYVIFPCLPLTVDLGRAMQGKPPTAWDDTKAAAFGVMPRYGTADDLKWIEVDPRFAFHSANAYEKDGKLHVEVAGARKAPLMPNADGTPPDLTVTKQVLTRWSMGTDGNSSGFSEEILGEHDIQFPRIDDRLTGRPYDYMYTNIAALADSGRVDGFESLARYRVSDGVKDVFTPDAATAFGEPVFVPSSPDAPADDGYLLALGWDRAANRSTLYVMDAQNVSAGPLAKVKLPFRVPGGFHCSWRAAA